MGVAYWYSKNDRNVIHRAPSDAKIGLAVYHINKPHYSFQANGESKLPCDLFYIHRSFATKLRIFMVSEFNSSCSGKTA